MKGIEGKIMKLRIEKGISKADMSRACSITPTAYSNIEEDLTESINIETGRKIAKALGISFNELFEIEGDSQKIDGLNNEIQLLKNRISELSLFVETLKNEKEHIKAYLVMQMVSAYSFETGLVDSEFTSANSDEDRCIRSQLLDGIQRVYDINKAYYIRTGFLTQSDFDNHYKEMKGMYQYLPNEEPDKPGKAF